MNKNISKKGAVELSLNLIIMLIIGMVVLGLVIGFVNSLVSKGTESFETQLGDNEKLKLEEVSRCPGNLCVIPDPSVTIKKGGKQNVFIKVRAYDVNAIDCSPGSLANCGLTYEAISDSDSTPEDGIKLSGPGFDAPEGTEDANMYTLSVDTTVPVGTYYLTLTLYPGDDETSKTITVEVN